MPEYAEKNGVCMVTANIPAEWVTVKRLAAASWKGVIKLGIERIQGAGEVIELRAENRELKSKIDRLTRLVQNVYAEMEEKQDVLHEKR